MLVMEMGDVPRFGKKSIT